jgi:hypothetical protein
MGGSKVVSVARDFSKYPAGRYVTDGPASGEAFRERFLLPAMSSGDALTIELDGTRGYGSSFLEEAFGGLVRKGFDPSAVIETFRLVSGDDSLLDEIKEYIAHGKDPE